MAVPRPCRKCREVRIIVGQQLCGRCYQQREAVVCRQCEKTKTQAAKGLCHSCYRAHRDGLVVCLNCAQIKKLRANGLCHACSRGRTLIECPDCHEIRPKSALGRCSSCYQKIRRANPEIRAKDYLRGLVYKEIRRTRGWAERTRYGQGKNRAALTLPFLRELQNKTPNCPWCRCLLDYGRYTAANRPPNLATIDKRIPEFGYVPNNVMVLCFQCNRKKNDITPEEALTLAKLLNPGIYVQIPDYPPQLQK